MKTPLHQLPALSLRQPWAWAILHAGKRIENRSRRTHYRGEFLIHASSSYKFRIYNAAVEFIREIRPDLTVPAWEQLPHGAIVGVARVAACIEVDPWDPATSDWAVGPFGYVLEDVRPLLQPIPCKGALGFFNHGLPAEAFAGQEAA